MTDCEPDFADDVCDRLTAAHNLRLAFRPLTPTGKRLLFLVYGCGLTYEEAARALGRRSYDHQGAKSHAYGVYRRLAALN